MNYLNFILIDSPSHYKTKIWKVFPKEGDNSLGHIKWFNSWRKYCFFPEFGMVFDYKCLQEISSFCYNQTEHRRIDSKNEKNLDKFVEEYPDIAVSDHDPS